MVDETRTPDPTRELVVVSNRLPVRCARDGGSVAWKPSPGGLVSALSPVLRDRGGLWIGWAGHHDLDAPAEHGGLRMASVRLERGAVRRYYDGFSNSSIWPLYHDSLRPARFETSWWDCYEEVNARFAAVVAARAGQAATIWVHDYHLQRLPELLRSLRPDLRIGFFLHIPFPPLELMQQLPWREQILRGLLGADLVGFHTRAFADNFARAALQLDGVESDLDGLRVDRARRVHVGAFPISIDVERVQELAQQPRTRLAAERLRDKLGRGRCVVLGVDRLDYTKGIQERLLAYLRLLDEKRVRAEECVLVQVAVPSRERVRHYAEERARVERLVGEINGRHGEPGREAVHYVYRSLPMPTLVSHYLAADVMAVTPLRDGMNLVAKEYVASRLDEDGVLLLSEFAGAAAELREAVVVNPHDVGGMADALAACLGLDVHSARERMRALRRVVCGHDVHAWASAFLHTLDRHERHRSAALQRARGGDPLRSAHPSPAPAPRDSHGQPVPHGRSLPSHLESITPPTEHD